MLKITGISKEPNCDGEVWQASDAQVEYCELLTDRIGQNTCDRASEPLNDDKQASTSAQSTKRNKHEPVARTRYDGISI